MSSIFISHSSKDNQFAEDLRKQIEQRGHHSIFLDFDPQQGIPAGTNWEQILYAKLRVAQAVIVLCSRYSMSSNWVFAEITHARSQGKHIFPLKISECEPVSILNDTQIIDFTREQNLERLWQGIEAANLDSEFSWDSKRSPYPGLITGLESEMKLTAILTKGWNYKSRESNAMTLHESALSSGNYIHFLSSQLTQNNIDQIYQLEQLFRKSTTGFKPIKKFVGALTENPDNRSLNCYIDVFTYSFLKGAKNFDLLLPFDKNKNREFIATFKNWLDTISSLEDFERSGECIDKEIKNQYLPLRKIIARPSARDEIRTLATLLVSGPSTLKEVSEDLGLNYTLGQRTVGVFESIGIVQQRESGLYAIATDALPVVIFCLRETIGLDLLSNLDLEEKYLCYG